MSAVAAPLHRPPVRHEAVAGPLGLALLMHALLFAGMTLAVQWRTQPQAPIMAELWSGLPPPVVAAVVAPPPPPPVVQQPPPPPQPEPERPADIALEQKKAPPKVEEKKVEAKKEEKKAEPKKAELKKDERKPEPRKEEAKTAEARPPSDLERIMAQANAQGQPAAATGTTAAGSTVRGDATYAAQVIGCVRPHINFVVPEGTSADVYADYRVELLPDGSVANVRLLRPSGLANYDAAAERAIRRCDPFPRKRDGKFDQTIDVRMSPVEAR